MFKYLVFLAMVAVAFAAPQILLNHGVLDNEGAKQLGLPFANGWTDGPNNGVGPVVHLASPVVSHVASPIVSHISPTVYAAGAHYVL